MTVIPNMNEAPDGMIDRTAGEMVVKLYMRQPVSISPGSFKSDQISLMFGADKALWLGELIDKTDGRRNFACDLELRVRPESKATFHKAAIVSLGRPLATELGWIVPCEWRASGLAPLFPVFVGALRFEPDAIVLDGYYAPPFGLLGYAMDRALLGIAARGTARWFLRQVANGLG